MIFSKILIPVDASRHSESAVNYGSALAEISEAKVILLHCHRPIPTGLGEPNFQKAIDDATRDSYAILEKHTSMLKAKNIEFDEKIIGGSTAKSIKAVAETEGCDLIVMGSKGKSDLEGLVVGSVTHKVLHIAPCPVLVIK
ncbi:universal stress protein [Maridesulfovibrio hydrothermalis]|uniref:Universal stress protein n=1 Tax=Maridesulfovibrio hydrothermalis AM13 = DSM 14728 TaxID=1121451 RepID=L0RF01_9BACT|nr:universal stress protein [Maridesulfovibrio hydrothermalis]CCO24787.1 UspA domain protein [Maridesulfovibrio hydrothermalis AM13 = DSM 14728]